MNKVQNIFATLTARYGRLQPKDGQLLPAVAQSWESAVGRYSLHHLQSACVHWMNTSKYPRWPEPAEMLEILRDMGCEPEKALDAAKPSYASFSGYNDAAQWFKETVTRRAPPGSFPFTMEMAILNIIGAELRHNRGRPLPQLLGEAWMRGDIPNGFDQKAKAYFEEMQVRKSGYLAAVKSKGAAAVHEGRARWLNQ